MSTTVSRHQNFVGGEWVDAVEGQTMEVLNPATGEAIAEVPRGTQGDVDRAVDAASVEIPFCTDNLRFFAGAARCLGGPVTGEYLRGYTSMIRREPVGVVG